MRLIVIGCEYVGKSALIERLDKWGQERGIKFHLDDHFTLPDERFNTPEDQALIMKMSPSFKERYQRFQVIYHVRLLHRYEHILLGGFHIEENIYGPLYYYPGVRLVHDVRELEKEMPANTILLLLTAKPEAIVRWMKAAPHPHAIIRQEDIPMLLERFEKEFNDSLIRQKMRIDTTELTTDGILDAFLRMVSKHLDLGDPVAAFLPIG